MAGPPASPEWLDLRPDERVVLQAAPSSNLVLVSLIAGVAMMLGMAVVVGFFTSVATGRRVSFVVLVGIVALIAGTFVLTKRREYVVTTARVCTAVGLTGERVTEYPIEHVRDVTVEQSGWQQLFNLGTLRFATDDEDVRFSLVENPTGLQGRILQFIELGGR
jgi:uncharacterized membrane protein YdbT with pleckstrin-like domain